MPEPFYKKTENLKINLRIDEAEKLEEYAMRKGLTLGEAASELIIKALNKMESELYSQIEMKNTYGYKD